MTRKTDIPSQRERTKIAARADVSTMTVYRYFCGKNVHPLFAKAINDAMAELGIVWSPTAKAVA